MQNLTNTVFATGPMDDLRVVDAYGIDSNKVINSIQEKDSEVDSDKEAAFELIPPAKKDKEKILALKEKAPIKQTSSGLQSSFSDTYGLGANSVITGLPIGLKTSVTAPNGFQKLSVESGGNTALVNNFSATDVKAMSNLIGVISKGNLPITVKDLGAITTIGANSIVQAAAIGIPNTYAAVCSGITDLSVITNITKEILPTIVKNSDVALLKQVANGLVVKDVKTMMPGIIPAFANNFKNIKGITQNGKINTALSVLDSFNKIDPTWNQAKPTIAYSNPGDVFSSQDVMCSSKDFKDNMGALGSSKLTTAKFNGSLTRLNNGEQKTAIVTNALYKQPKPVYDDLIDTDECLRSNFEVSMV